MKRKEPDGGLTLVGRMKFRLASQRPFPSPRDVPLALSERGGQFQVRTAALAMLTWEHGYMDDGPT